MQRLPEECPHWRPALTEQAAGVGICALVQRILGLREGDEAAVAQEACAACCHGPVPTAQQLNPVVASHIYRLAFQRRERPGASTWEVAEAERASRYVRPYLQRQRLPRDVPEGKASGHRDPAASGRAITARIGLVGWNTASGLGYQNRDIAENLPLDRWLVPRHSRYPTLPDPPRVGARIDRVPLSLSEDHLRKWLRGLDWVMFVELPYFPHLPRLAREAGVRVACVPNWEFAGVQLRWIPFVDAMLCPTAFTHALISDWKERFDFGWRVVHLPWPVDADRFRFRQRSVCRRYLFVNGTGGVPGRRPDGTLTPYRRKGAAVFLEAARLLPKIRFTMISQVEVAHPIPANVTVQPAPGDNAMLYESGDVCVQPSFWEGLGLQLLECQAAGLPLVTTDAPPMNEYRPLAAVPVAETEVIEVQRGHPVTANLVSPRDLAAACAALFDRDIAAASCNAREFVERERSWQRARARLMQLLAPAEVDAAREAQP